VTVTSETLDRSRAAAVSASSSSTSPSASAPAVPLATTEPEGTDVADDATAEPATEPTIGYISLDETQAFVLTITGGVREAAAEAGIGLLECDSGWTRPGVLACATQMAEAGVSGVISMQPFPDLAEDVCDTLGGVPTIGIVYDQGPCQVSLFEIDQAESGRLAGAALGAFAAKRFDCDVKAYVSLGSSVEDEIGGARMEGYQAGYQEHCPMPKQTRLLNDAQHLVTAQNQFQDVLDEIKGKPIIVAGVSEDAILGAMGAAERRDRAGQVWYSGQLADPAIRQTIACDPHYIASVAQFPERFGSTVVPALLEAIEGAAVPPELPAELELVTADNVRELFPDTPACDG
jgi:ribose transport system substrate-binding protein